MCGHIHSYSVMHAVSRPQVGHVCKDFIYLAAGISYPFRFRPLAIYRCQARVSWWQNRQSVSFNLPRPTERWRTWNSFWWKTSFICRRWQSLGYFLAMSHLGKPIDSDRVLIYIRPIRRLWEASTHREKGKILIFKCPCIFAEENKFRNPQSQASPRV